MSLFSDKCVFFSVFNAILSQFPVCCSLSPVCSVQVLLVIDPLLLLANHTGTLSDPLLLLANHTDTLSDALLLPANHTSHVVVEMQLWLSCEMKYIF